MVSISLSRMATSVPLFAALVFIVVGSPVVYRAVDKILGETLGIELADGTGRPTRLGLILHALVVFLMVTLFMRAK